MSSPNPAKIVSRSRVVASPPGAIFDLLADPRRHGEIDGSDTIKSAQSGGPERLALDATFGMSMHMGVSYKITNTVVEFVEGKQIAWRHMGGHIWRYILTPADGATEVTEQFDWNNSRSPLVLRIMRSPQKNGTNIEKTLEKLVQKFE